MAEQEDIELTTATSMIFDVTHCQLMTGIKAEK